MTRMLLSISLLTLALVPGQNAPPSVTPPSSASTTAAPQSSSPATAPAGSAAKPGASAQASTPSSTQVPTHDASKSDSSKEAYVFERHYTRITQEDDGTGVRERTVEVQVLSEAGVKALAVLSFPYTSANESIEFEYVRVRKPDGTVVKTPDYNIQDMPAEVSRSAPLYSDIHEKHVAVKGLSVGDVLEYVVRARIFKAEVPGHFWYEHWFTEKAIERDERLDISVPAHKYVKVVSPQFKPEIVEEGSRRIYRWKHANLAVAEQDPDEIPRRIPPSPDVQLTTFASWEDIGRWYGDLQNQPLRVTPAIQAKATELTQGLKTDDEKMHAIYNFVSLKYHYIGLDFGIGRYQPHAADDVLDNNYGDCKDKHTLLAALLKAAGYDAWPALIHASRKLDPDVPSPAQFNHVITVVPRPGGQYTWLDTTPEVAPYRLLMLQLRNKQALVIPTDGPPVLVTTPENPPEPQRQEFSMEGKLDLEGTFTGHAEQSYSGDVAVMLRAAFRQIPESQWKEGVQRFSYGLNFGGDVSNVKVTPPDEIDKPFEISYDYVRKNYNDWENHHTNAPLPPIGIEIAKDAKDRKPPEPIQLGALGKASYHGRVHLPAGYLAVAPERCHLVETFAEYTGDTRIENDVMTTTRELVIKRNEVPVSDWEKYRKFGRAISDNEFEFVPLNRVNFSTRKKDTDKDGKDKGDSASEGSGTASVDSLFRDGNDAMQVRDAGRAQELFEKVLSQQPDYKGAHLNLGLALMVQGKFDLGIEHFRKEEGVTPTDPRAYQAAGAALAQVGRRDDAIGEWRKLLKVDPQNRTAAAALGGLLYQAGKYADAAEVLEPAVQAVPDSHALQEQLGEAYLKAGQKEKAVPHIREAAESGSDLSADTMLLNNAAYALAESKTDLDLATRYAEGAVKQLDALSKNDSAAVDTGTRDTYQFTLLWDTLGWVYFQRGEVARAESFVRAAWLLGQDAIVGQHLGEIYEKEGKSKEAAHAYELALAAVGPSPVRAIGGPGHYSIAPAPDDPKQILTHDLTARYERLTGKKPELNTTWRLPNGEWTKSASEQLSLMRMVKFGKLPTERGSAEFTIVFSLGRVESVEYMSGEESLMDLTDKIKAAHYQVEFPAGSQAKLLRRAELSCFPVSGCMVVLMPTNKAAQTPGQQ